LVCVNFNDFFLEFSPTLTTRRHAYRLFKPRCTSSVRQNFYILNERVINLWNSQPPTVGFKNIAYDDRLEILRLGYFHWKNEELAAT